MPGKRLGGDNFTDLDIFQIGIRGGSRVGDQNGLRADQRRSLRGRTDSKGEKCQSNQGQVFLQGNLQPTWHLPKMLSICSMGRNIELRRPMSCRNV